MKISDCVEVIAESEKYTAGGVHKGMQGKIEYHSNGFDRWCVSFPNCTDRPTEIRLCINTRFFKFFNIDRIANSDTFDTHSFT